MKNTKLRQMTLTAMFAALATVLMFFELPLPFMPPFLKIDPSSMVVLIGGFLFGPVQAVCMALVKDLIHLTMTQTGGVGELADFLVTCAFVVVPAILYRRNKTKRTAILSCCLGVVLMTIVGVLANKYLLIPFYSQVMPIDAIISACAAVNPMIGSLNTYLLFGAAPFNMLKGIILSFLTILVYKKVSRALKLEDPKEYAALPVKEQ